MRIGELARQAGINKSVIDHYTRLGLIEPAQRSNGKYRLYSQNALDRINFIQKCQSKRFSLEEIRHFMGEKAPIEKAEVHLCMINADISIDSLVGELRNISGKIEQPVFTNTEMLRDRIDALAVKVTAASELLLSILNNLS